MAKLVKIVEGGDRVYVRVLAALGREVKVERCSAASFLEAGRPEQADLVVLEWDPAFGEGLAGALFGGHRAPPFVVFGDFPRASEAFRLGRLGAAAVFDREEVLDRIEAAIRGLLKFRSGACEIFDGESAAIRSVAERIKLFAPTSLPVLVLGESGTGKEIAARAIHNLSPRSAFPFVAQNGATLPPHLAESELFGSEAGAYTDARARPGLCELADRGTLFLDEIGDVPAEVQAKLLRVLEGGDFRRLGGRATLRSSLRLVCATSRELEEGSGFRRDLLYRIKVLSLRMPPLRERLEDIPCICACILGREAPGTKYLGPAALDRLGGHSWPGNIRQLRNVLSRAVVLSGSREEIRESDIEF